MLKKKINKIDEVDEALRGLYKQDGDSFILDVEEEVKPKSNDKELKELQKRLKELQDAKEASDQKTLEEQGNYKALHEASLAKQKELDELLIKERQTRLSTIKEIRASEFANKIKSGNEAKLYKKLLMDEHITVGDDGIVSYVVGDKVVSEDDLKAHIIKEFGISPHGGNASGGGNGGVVGKLGGTKEEEMAYIASKFNLKG